MSIIPHSSNIDESVIYIQDVSKVFRLYDSLLGRLSELALLRKRNFCRHITSLADINLNVKRGECLGIMGPNGAGKTTLLKIITGGLLPTTGRVNVQGRITMLDLGLRMNPELSGRDNLLVSGLAIGLTRKMIFEKLDEMIDFSELGIAIDDPVKTYSTGMSMRLAFSLYAFIQPDVLIIDEAFAVGDAKFILKCIQKLRELQNSGSAILLVSHDSNAIIELCDHAILLHHGKIMYEGDPVNTVDAYHAVLGLLKNGDGARVQLTQKADEIKPSSVNEFLQNAIRPKESSFHNQDVEILGIKVFCNSYPSNGIFHHGDECKVEWLIHAKRTVDCLTSGIHLHAQLGTYVFGTSYIHLGKPLSISIPAHYLLGIKFKMIVGPGKYVLSIGAAEPDLQRKSRGGNQLDRFLSSYEFEILDFDIPPNEPIPFFGLVNIPAEADHPILISED